MGFWTDLRLSPAEKAHLASCARSLGLIASVLEAMWAKAQLPPEPEPGFVLESEVQAMIDQIAARLAQTNAASAAEFKRVADEHFPPPVPTS